MNDEIQNAIAESWLIMSSSPIFYSDVAINRKIVTQLWSSLASTDDIVYSVFTMLRLLNTIYIKIGPNLHQTMDNEKLYASFLERLIPFFHHRIDLVRAECYALANIIVHLIVKTTSNPREIQSQLGKIVVLSLQAVTVELKTVPHTSLP